MMSTQEQSGSNAEASQQAATVPSGCKACKREGIAIYPLRVAAVPQPLVNTGWQPAVPPQDTELTGGEFKYALRTLRQGYVYVLLDKSIWQAYQVTVEGFLRQFNAYEMPESEKVDSLSPACLTQNHDVLASFINIDPNYSQAMVGFSSDPWCKTVLDEYKSGKRPATRFTQVTVSDGIATIEGAGRSLTLDPTLSALKSNALEFASESFPSVVGKDADPDGAHGFHPRMEKNKQTALGNKIAQLQQQYGAPVNAIVLDDTVGVVQEINHGRLDVVQALAAYTSEKSNIHQKTISDAILQIRASTTRQTENDPNIQGLSTPGYSTSYSVSRESAVAIELRKALCRMEDYYDEPARADFANSWQSTVDAYKQQMTAIWQDLDNLYASAMWLALLNDDYSPETSVISWHFQLRTIAACLQGSLAGCDTEKLTQGGKKPQWAGWLEDPMSPALMALLRNKHEFSAEVFKGSLTYSNLKAVLNSKEVSAFVNNKAYQQLAASLVSAIDGAFSSLYSTLSETAKGGVLRTLQAVAYVAEGSPVVTVFTGEMTIRDYQSILRTQLDIHGKSPLTMQTEEVGGALRSTRVGHWLQVTDPVVLEQRIQVRLTAPLSNQGKISGITMLTPEVIDNSLIRGEIALGSAEMRSIARYQSAISTDLQSGLLGLVLAGILINTTFNNIESLKTAMPGDTQAQMSMSSGSLIALACGVEMLGQGSAVLNWFNKGDLLIRSAGVIGGLATIVDGIALMINAWKLGEAGDSTAAVCYAIASVALISSGVLGVIFSAAGKFALFGPVGWCIALGILAVTFITIGKAYTRSPLERWLTHTCFGNRDECDESEVVWHKESLPDMREAMKALYIITSGVSAQLVGDWFAEMTNNTRLLGNRMMAARVILADCSPTGSDWLVELTATGNGGRQVLARSGSVAKLAGLKAPEPQSYETVAQQIGRGELTPMAPAVITKAMSATSLNASWPVVEGKLQGLQLDGQFPLNQSRFAGAELTVTYWPDKTRQDNSLQLTTELDS
ncbi:TPA: T6SS effector BTH_I2691 family protein [Citrobacter farmeri]